jgi:hypothetical protein
MINYWYDIIVEDCMDKAFYKAVIYANSDELFVTDGYLSSKDAQLAATFYIVGYKDARGEYE